MKQALTTSRSDVIVEHVEPSHLSARTKGRVDGPPYVAEKFKLFFKEMQNSTRRFFKLKKGWGNNNHKPRIHERTSLSIHNLTNKLLPSTSESVNLIYYVHYFTLRFTQ